MAKSGAANFESSMRVVVLHGAERFLIEQYSRRLAQTLEKAFGGLEQFAFDGQTADPAVVLDELRSYGLMQKHKLVVLDDADVFLAGGRSAARAAASDGSADDDDARDVADDEASAATGEDRSSRRPMMERYLQNPVDDATLLMRSGTWRKGNLDKLILKHGTIVACDSPGPERAVTWSIDRCTRRHGAQIDRDAAELLVHRIGSHLQRLDTELLKLAAMAGDAKGPARITRPMVEANTPASSEEKAWEIQKAVASGSAPVMLRKLHELIDLSRQDAVPISWAVIDLLRKEHAAARLLEQRVGEHQVPRMLKLWGESIGDVMRAARRVPPDHLAQLLREAVLSDQHSKSGVGEPVRNLETMMVRIADTTAAAG